MKLGGRSASEVWELRASRSVGSTHASRPEKRKLWKLWHLRWTMLSSTLPWKKRWMSTTKCGVLRWKWHISQRLLNLNVYSIQKYLRDFRFRRENIEIITLLCKFHGLLSRYEHTATCTLLQHLASTTIWKELEVKLGMLSSQLSEILWDIAEYFNDTVESVLCTYGALFPSRANRYANPIRKFVASLSR